MSEIFDDEQNLKRDEFGGNLLADEQASLQSDSTATAECQPDTTGASPGVNEADETEILNPVDYLAGLFNGSGCEVAFQFMGDK